MGEDKHGESGKDVAFYSAIVSAWVETRMERDRSLITLSSAGIGLIVTLLTTVGVRSCWLLVLYILSTTAFLTTILTTVVVFARNASYLQRLAQSADTSDDKVLVRLDMAIVWSFVLGVALLAAIGVLSAWTGYVQSGG